MQRQRQTEQDSEFVKRVAPFPTALCVHMSEPHTPGSGRDVTVQLILGALRGCPLLETRQLHDLSPAGTRPTISPHLRGIELGAIEARSGLITCLRFPSNVTAGFRMRSGSDLRNCNHP